MAPPKNVLLIVVDQWRADERESLRVSLKPIVEIYNKLI